MEKTCNNCQRVFTTSDDFLRDTSRWRICSQKALWFNCCCGSTLMLPEGRYPWYDPTSKMSETSASVFNQIANIESIPAIPNAVFQLQTKIDDQSIDASELARLVKKEPYIATETLRIAENIRKSRNPGDKSIQSIQHAIVYIGRKTLGEIIIAASLKEIELKTVHYTHDVFWREAFLTAAIAEIIAGKFCPNMNRDEVFLAGCLANIGKLVSAILKPEITDEIFLLTKNPKKPRNWRSAEIKLNVNSHTILGEIAAVLWGLPEFVLVSASFHHAANKHQVGGGEIEVVAMANQLMHWLLAEPERIDQGILNRGSEYFGLSEKGLENLVKEILPMRDQISLV